VREGARPTKISKQHAIVKTLVAKTLKGDLRAATTLTSMMYRVLDLKDEAEDPEEPLSADEQEALALLEARVSGQSRSPRQATGDAEEEETNHE